jgi:hypothetical protein
MQAAQIGREYGLDLAEARLRGATEFEPLSLDYLRERLREDER